MDLVLWIPEPPSVSQVFFDLYDWLLQTALQLLSAAWWCGFIWGATSVLLALVRLSGSLYIAKLAGLACRTRHRRAQLVGGSRHHSPERVRLVLDSGLAVSVPKRPKFD